MKASSVTFGAKPINNVKIKKFNEKTKRFEDCFAKFVKIDANNKTDLCALNSLVKDWEDAKYIRKIVTASHWMNVREYVEIDVYALTSQKKDFEKLRAKKILGLVEMRNDDENPKNRKIWYLQVKPKAMNVNNENNKYKYVGTSILDSLKKIYKNMSLFSNDNKNVVEFYKANGFVEDFRGKNHFSWSSNIFKRLLLKINEIMKMIQVNIC